MMITIFVTSMAVWYPQSGQPLLLYPKSCPGRPPRRHIIMSLLPGLGPPRRQNWHVKLGISCLKNVLNLLRKFFWELCDFFKLDQLLPRRRCVLIQRSKRRARLCYKESENRFFAYKYMFYFPAEITGASVTYTLNVMLNRRFGSMFYI